MLRCIAAEARRRDDEGFHRGRHLGDLPQVLVDL